jgi:hypothetical protein
MINYVDDQRKSITISANLFDEIKNRIKNPINGFSSIEEYVDYVLEEVLFEKEDSSVSDEEKQKIQDELKKLGYI